MRALHTAVTVLVFSGGPVVAQTTGALATIPETESFGIHSEVVGADFRISVALPPLYEQMADATFPVLYVLDGYWTFGMAAGIARVIAADQLIPPLLVVGIGYPGGFGDAVALRVRDMTLRQSDMVEQFVGQMVARLGGGPPITSGGAAKFLRFLTEELMPVVERNYRVDQSRRVLHGHSLGGNFVVDVLFSHPTAFTHYIASAPSLPIDDRVSFVNEQRFAAENDSLPASLYLAVGLLDGQDLIASVDALGDTLSVREYKGFQWTVSRLEDQTHRSVMPAVLRDGLRWIFRK